MKGRACHHQPVPGAIRSQWLVPGRCIVRHTAVIIDACSCRPSLPDGKIATPCYSRGPSIVPVE